jgi:CBS domain-containing protein
MFMAKLARDVMTPRPECIEENKTIAEAAVRLAKRDVGALPICDDGGRLKGLLTEHDIVQKVIATGKDPKTTRVGEVTQSNPTSVKADDPLDAVLRRMIDAKAWRLPVIEDKQVVGILTQADLALNLPHEKTGELLEAIAVQSVH